jgi:hypothetical protein
MDAVFDIFSITAVSLQLQDFNTLNYHLLGIY